jgi:hypothetical protein
MSVLTTMKDQVLLDEFERVKRNVGFAVEAIEYSRKLREH